MQARLLAELKKTTGETPLTRGAAAGTFGLKIYPPRAVRSAEPKETPVAKEKEKEKERDKKEADAPAKKKKPAAKAAAAPEKPAKKPARAKAAAAPKGRGKAKAAQPSKSSSTSRSGGPRPTSTQQTADRPAQPTSARHPTAGSPAWSHAWPATARLPWPSGARSSSGC